MTSRFEPEAQALLSLLQLGAPPIAITFHDSTPPRPQPLDAPFAAPTATGRTGRASAGCVFWMLATERSFTTVAADHANCSVGSYTHGFISLAEAATHEDVTTIVDAGWVDEADFARIPAVATTPEAVSYEPLNEGWSCDVVLVRLHAAGLMTLVDAWPRLSIEGKPQCHIVAQVKERGGVAASVGCALSRARTGMSATEATAAIAVNALDDLLEVLHSTATANAAVARYAGADAERFAAAPS
jgi:uncharacterized protein (DUF169 family)